MRNALKALTAGVLLLAWVATTGDLCSGDEDSTSPNTVPINSRLVNGDEAPVHLFGPGETFPCCQVAAGGERMWHDFAVVKGQGIQFRAGRNGEIVGSVTCVVDDVYATLNTTTVIWTGAGLGCSGTW